MTTALGILSGTLIIGALALSIVWGAISTARERREMRSAPLVRRDIETALRDCGCYVVHAESHFDLQLTLF